MAELGVMETIAIAGLVAFVMLIASMPIGAKLGRSAGRRTLLGTLVAFVAVSALRVVLALGDGGMVAFKREYGTDALLQIGSFLLIVLFTTYFFASRYIGDLDR